MDTPRIVTRRTALRSGDNDDALRRRVRSQELIRIRRGSYTDSDYLDLPGTDKHLMRLDAVASALDPEEVFSHVSAALLHGLPLWRTPLDHVHITKVRSSGGHRTTGLHTHTAPLAPSELTSIGGRRVTSLARTVVDLARSVPFEQGVVVADAALRTKRIDRVELIETAGRVHRRHGAATARAVAEFSSSLSESVGESRSRVLMHVHGVPMPTEQYEIRGRSGEFLGRSDFAWDGGRIIGEFDGMVKYGRHLRPGESAGDAVFREKQREDRIRDTDRRVIRWVWADLDDPAALVQRWRHALSGTSLG